MAAVPGVGARTARRAQNAQVPQPSATSAQRRAAAQQSAYTVRQAAGTNAAHLTPDQAEQALATAPADNPAYQAIRLAPTRIARLIHGDVPTTLFNPQLGAAARIRDYLVGPMPVDASIIVNASGFTEAQISILTQNSDDHFFNIFAAFAVRQWRSVEDPEGGEPIHQMFRCGIIFAYGSGNNLVQTIREMEDHYGAERMAITQVIVTKKLIIQNATARQLETSTQLQYAAAGFADIICAPEHFDQAPIPLFFPSTYGHDCFVQIVGNIFNSLFPSNQFTANQNDWLLTAIRFLLHRIRTDGITSHAITAFNRHCADNPLTINNTQIAIQIYKHIISSDRVRPPSINTTNIAIPPGVEKRIFHVMTINYAGQIATAKNQGSGGLHYIWVKSMPSPFTAQAREQIESICAAKIESHREAVVASSIPPDGVTRVNYRLLHDINLQQMKQAAEREASIKTARDAARASASRKRARDADGMDTSEGSGEAALAQQAQCDIASSWVCVYDIESKFSKVPTATLPPDLVESGHLKGDVCVHHPFLIHFGMFKLFANSSGRNLPFSAATTQDEAESVLDHHKFDLFYVRDESTTAEHNFIVNNFLGELSRQCKIRNVQAIRLFAHNGSKYDHHLLFHFYHNDPRCKIENVLITPRGILGATFIYDDVRIDLRCTALHLSKSLAELCIDLDVPKCMWKREFDFSSDFTHEFYENMSEDDKAKLIDYAKYDIYCLTFILIRLEELLQKLDPIRPCDVDFNCVQGYKPQCGKMTFQSFIRGMLMKQFFDSPFPPPRIILYDEVLLSSLRGGMTQSLAAFFQSPIYTFLQSVPLAQRPRAYKFATHQAEQGARLRRSITLADPDRNSLYPFTMKSRGVPKGPAHLLKWGVEQFCREYIFDRPMEQSKGWGVVLARLPYYKGGLDANLLSCHFPLLSYRTKTGNSMLYTNSIYSELPPHLKDKLADYSESFLEDNGYAWYTTDHLAVFDKIGIAISFEVGFFWSAEFDNWSTEYQPFITHMYDERQRNRANNTVQQIYKLGMNGAFGSSGQKATTTTHIISTKPLPSTHLITNTLRNTRTIGDGQFNLYELEAKAGCLARELSCKSTVTNSILSGSWRTMMEAQIQVFEADDTDLSLADVYDLTIYMDTDSNYCLKEYVNMLGYLGKMGKDIGQFSTESGDIIRFFAPAAKLYAYEHIQDGQIKVSGKCKGLPLYKTSVNRESGKIEKEENVDIIQTFEQLMDTGELSADKTVWNKGVGHGVTTADTKYTVDGATFTTSSNRIGWHTQITPGGCILQRWIPVGFKPSSTDEGVFSRRYFSEFRGDCKAILECMADERELATGSLSYRRAVADLVELFPYYKD